MELNYLFKMIGPDVIGVCGSSTKFYLGVINLYSLVQVGKKKLKQKTTLLFEDSNCHLFILIDCTGIGDRGPDVG